MRTCGVIFMRINHLLYKIRFALLKKRIKKNPYLGKEDIGGDYLYKQGDSSIRYRIIHLPGGKNSIEWVSEKLRMRSRHADTKGIKKTLFKFRHYQGWLVLFRPPIVFLLLIGIIIAYFSFIEREETKVNRFKGIVAAALAVNPQEIEYIGDGWLQISTQRKTAADKINEPVVYTFNPLKWFFSSAAGSTRRWRGEPYGYVTYPIVYNERGEVWINKEGTWRHGKVSGKTINWDVPQGTGIRAGKVTGHEISQQDKKLQISDK
jgi:hypothetical protein